WSRTSPCNRSLPPRWARGWPNWPPRAPPDGSPTWVGPRSSPCPTWRGATLRPSADIVSSARSGSSVPCTRVSARVTTSRPRTPRARSRSRSTSTRGCVPLVESPPQELEHQRPLERQLRVVGGCAVAAFDVLVVGDVVSARVHLRHHLPCVSGVHPVVASGRHEQRGWISPITVDIVVRRVLS